MKYRVVVGFAAFVTFYTLNVTVNTLVTSYETAVTMAPHPHHTMLLCHASLHKCRAGINLMIDSAAARSTRPSLWCTCVAVSAAV